jgi:hypothetical protein
MQDTYNYMVDALRAAPTVLDTLLHVGQSQKDRHRDTAGSSIGETYHY